MTQGRERQCHRRELLRALLRLALEHPGDARHHSGARGHARQYGLGRADRKHLDGQQGRLGEDRPETDQFPETGGGPDAAVRRLDPAQSGLKKASNLLPVRWSGSCSVRSHDHLDDTVDRGSQHGLCRASVEARPSHDGNRLHYLRMSCGGRCYRSGQEQPECGSHNGGSALSCAAHRAPPQTCRHFRSW